jgi:hypothetical protein
MSLFTVTTGRLQSKAYYLQVTIKNSDSISIPYRM